MNKNDIFPSKYLTAADLPEEGMTLTIRFITVERMMDGVEKPIASFVERQLPDGKPIKDMIINVTKWNTITKMYGDESDDWHGKRISIRPGETKMKGDVVACIDVSSRKPGEPKKANGRAKGSPEAEKAIAAASEANDDSDDDTTPF